jgi:hypothetical protein
MKLSAHCYLVSGLGMNGAIPTTLTCLHVGHRDKLASIVLTLLALLSATVIARINIIIIIIMPSMNCVVCQYVVASVSVFISSIFLTQFNLHFAFN